MNKYDFIREMVPKHGCRWVAEALGATARTCIYVVKRAGFLGQDNCVGNGAST